MLLDISGQPAAGPIHGIAQDVLVQQRANGGEDRLVQHALVEANRVGTNSRSPALVVEASSRFSASARRFSRSRTLAASSLGDWRPTEGVASLDLAGFGPRRIGLPCLSMNRPGTG